MKRELSLFIDESGDFGFKKGASDFYFLTFVFHDQRKSIRMQIQRIQDYGCFHAGPLIRHEPPYENLDVRERWKIFMVFSSFVSSLPISIHTFFWSKKECEGSVFKLEATMARDLLTFFELNQPYFQRFSEIKVYYGKGQYWISRLLNLCFAKLPFNFIFKEQVTPEKYRLFQVADFASTVRLFETKMKSKNLSRSEKAFMDERYFRKIFVKVLNKKNLL